MNIIPMVDEKNEAVSPNDNKIWCKDNIVYYIISAPVDEKEASRLSNCGIEFIEKKSASKVLINLKQSTQFSSEARKIWVEFLKHQKIEKTAILGGNVFIRTLASFVIAASKKKNIKFFITEEKAMKWLNS
jgi:hypothetical protein